MPDHCQNKYDHGVTAGTGLAGKRTKAYFRADLPHSLPASNQLLAAVWLLSSFKRSALTDCTNTPDPPKQSQFHVQRVLPAVPQWPGRIGGRGNRLYLKKVMKREDEEEAE